MESYQRLFIEFAIKQQALKFGEFTLKSGRHSPYFFKAGGFSSGSALAQLGQAYAAAIVASKLEFDMLYGPAYKGIPLVAAVAISLAESHRLDLPYAFNRKEVKDHGEGGTIVGAPLSGRVLIVDDVISAGTSVRESVDIINQAGAQPCGVAIALDRQERGNSALSAVQEVESNYGLQVINIVGLHEIVAYLKDQPESGEQLAAIESYQSQYGC